MFSPNPLEAQLADFLETLPTRPQLLALGEPTHGLNAFPYWRNQLWQMLVEQYGFRSIALESDILAGERVGTYVMGAEADLAEVMTQGFSHNFGAYAANRDLVLWLHEPY